MKKCFLNVLALTLFLNSCTILAMNRRVEDFYEESDSDSDDEILGSRTGMDAWAEDDSESRYDKLYKALEENVPDEVTTWGISSFLDAKSLYEVKDKNRFFKDRVEECISPINQRDLESGFGVFSYKLSPEKVERADRQVQRELKYDEAKRIIFIEQNGEPKELFNKKMFRDTVFGLIEDPKLLKKLRFLDDKRFLDPFCFSVFLGVIFSAVLVHAGSGILVGIGGGIFAVGIGGGIVNIAILEGYNFIEGGNEFGGFLFDLVADCYSPKKRKLKKKLRRVFGGGQEWRKKKKK